MGSRWGLGVAQALAGLQGRWAKINASEQRLPGRNSYRHLLSCPNSKVSILDDRAGHRFKVSFALGSAQMLEETSTTGDRSFSFKNVISQ